MRVEIKSSSLNERMEKVKNLFPEGENMVKTTDRVKQRPFLLADPDWLVAMASIAEEVKGKIPEIEDLFRGLKAREIEYVGIRKFKVRNSFVKTLAVWLIRLRARGLAIRMLSTTFDINSEFLKGKEVKALR